MSKPIRKILVFLLITFLLSGIFYFLIIKAGALGNFSIGLMWCPGIAGIATQLIFERSLRGLGWRFRPVKYQVLAYLTPLAYALAAYLVLWLTGLGRFDPQTAQNAISAQFGISATLSTPVFTGLYFLIIATVVVITGGLLPALGEEIGWRGLFVPELAKVTSFTNVSLISGAVWAIWHAPVLFFADYNNAGAPRWYGLLCFATLVVAISFVFAWLRLKSGSLWTATILHAAHNAFIQAFFTPLTADTGRTAYFFDEFGLLLALAGIVTAWLFWRKRAELPIPEQALT
jgi:uncharacterized protein